MKNGIKTLLLLLVALSLVFAMAGCNDEEVAETTAPPETTEPDATQAPTEPEEEPTEEPTEPENVIEAGKMSIHPKGKNGDSGIYFTMEPNDIPVDTSWKTEFKPKTYTTILLYRDGETIKLGNTMTGMVIKYSETEYYLKLEKWNIGNFFPIRDGDVILVDGEFRNASLDVTFRIDPTYILVSEGLVFFSDEYPDANAGVQVIYTGPMTSHANGKTETGIYCTMEKNSVPYDDWNIEYTPASESAIQLIRDGNTYNIGNKAAGTLVKFNDTGYYLKLEQWIIKDFFPIRDGDILVVDGKFVNSGTATVFKVQRTYISINEGLLSFSTEYPTGSTVEAQKIPTLQPHPNGYTGTGLYFKAEENTLPYDGWTVEYFPREAGCIKLIRDGQTYDIANPDAGTIVKFSDTDYYLKLEQWIYKNYFPFVDGDILVVEGKFVNAGLAGLMEIGKTYISISSGMAYFSTEFPDGPVGPTKIQGSAMSSHPEGWNSAANGGLFFKMEPNEAPFATDWGLRYVPSAASNVKLIRDGVTYDVANTGAEMLVKYRETEYYLEFWPIPQKPIVEGDVLVVEGNFVNAANDVVLSIEKTYITIENGQPVFSTDLSSVIAAGYMQPHENGWNAAANDGLYFKLNANEIPYDGWNVEYEPVSAASIQLIRGDETYNIGMPSRGTIVKYGETDYYLKLSTWTVGAYAPIVPGDVLVVDGQFTNTANGVTFAIARTVITVGENYELIFTQEAPVDPTIDAGLMQPHPNGWNTANNKGMYFTMDTNDVPFSDDWATFYYPTTAGNIKLVRDGEIYELAQTDREFIVKFADTGYYLKLEKWTIGDYAPIVPGDLLIVEGVFTNPIIGVDFRIAASYITVGENYVLTFSDQAPEEDDGPIQAGVMSSHTNGFNTSGMDGLYATMAPNAAPYDGWNIEYTPVEAANYKLVRDGQTIDIGMPGRGTLVKFNETDYYLKFGWCVGEYANTITVGDQLIVEGLWRQNTGGEAVMEITKTVITIGENYVLTFDTEGSEPENPDVPVQENHGPMAANHENGWTGGTAAPWGGLYFTMAENDVPFESWNIRYNPTSAANIKLIRDGVSHDVGNTAAETIVKYSATEYYMEFWPISVKPVLAGDVLVVEGEFVNAASGATLNIAKTTITFNADGTATFESDSSQPEQPEIPDVPAGDPMAAHGTNGWTATGGMYFTMAKNDAPYDAWNTRYTPVAASCVKLIRGGMTYDVGHTARETIVKYSDTEYYYEFWTLDTYKPVLAGDVLVVEGNFVNAASGATLTIAKTTITFNADGTATFSSGSAAPEQPENPDDTQEGLPMLPWSEKAWNTGSNGGFWFTMAENDIPADETWALEYTPVTEDVLKLVRDGQTVNIGIPGRGTLIKASEAEYYLKLEWNVGDYANAITVGDVLIVEGDFTNATNGVTFTVAKTTVTVGENYVLTFESETEDTPEAPQPDDDAIQAGTMAKHSSNFNATNLFFTMAENEVPFHLTRAIYKPVSAGVIKLVRDGVTYDIGDPAANTVQKTTKSNYKFLLAAFGDKMPLQEGDLLIVEGKFTGGNTTTDVVVTFNVTKTYISIVDGTATFSDVDPRS